MRLGEVLSRLGMTYVKTLDRSHRHYLVRDGDGNLFILIFTNRTLRKPKSLGIDYEGEMFGLKRHYIDYYLRTGNYAGVIWVYSGDAYIADSYAVREVVALLKTCVKRGFEVICHYPVKSAKRVPLSDGLTKFYKTMGCQ